MTVCYHHVFTLSTQLLYSSLTYHIGILHILQDDTQMSTLDFRLISEHTLDNEENQSLFYAHDILKGMEFLVANQVRVIHFRI